MRRILRLLDTGAGEPAHNMAVDEVLLAGAGRRPTLRFYAWDPEAVSLGFFQPFERLGGRPVVRRITGGGAILHRDELTFAVAAPVGFLGEGGGVKASFHAVHRAIAAGLAHVGVKVEGQVEVEVEVQGGVEPFLCFERKSETDLTFRGRKLVGSAQRRSGRAVLQHGSIPLGSQASDCETLTVSAAAGRPVSYDEVAGAVARGFREALDVDLEPGGLEPGEVEAARRLAVERYGADAWTARR
jgi:lipoate-protein ligase A